MNRLGHDLLARAGLPLEQHRDRDLGQSNDAVKDLSKGVVKGGQRRQRRVGLSVVEVGGRAEADRDAVPKEQDRLPQLDEGLVRESCLRDRDAVDHGAVLRRQVADLPRAAFTTEDRVSRRGQPVLELQGEHDPPRFTRPRRAAAATASQPHLVHAFELVTRRRAASEVGTELHEELGPGRRFQRPVGRR